MGSFSIWHWLIVALVILLLFGRGRISEMMGDLGKGVNSFKKGLSEDDSKRDALLNPPHEDMREARRQSGDEPVAEPVRDTDAGR